MLPGHVKLAAKQAETIPYNFPQTQCSKKIRSGTFCVTHKNCDRLIQHGRLILKYMEAPAALNHSKINSGNHRYA